VPGAECRAPNPGSASASEDGTAGDHRPCAVVGLRRAVGAFGAPQRAIAHEVMDLRNEVATIGKRPRTHVFGQDQGAGFEDRDPQSVICQFDRRGDAAGAAADDQTVDSGIDDCLGAAEQDGRKWTFHAGISSREANAAPTFWKAAMMSSTSWSVRTEVMLSSAARSDIASQTGSAPFA